MMKIWTSLLAGATAVALVAGSASAQLHPNLTLDGFTTIFHDDFNSAPTGGVTGASNTAGWNTFTAGTGLEIVQDTNNYFGAGTSNQVLRSDGAKSWTLTFNIPSYLNETVGAFSFDMRHLGYPALGTGTDGANETNRLTTRFFTGENASGGTMINFGLQVTNNNLTPPPYRVRDEPDTLRTADPNEIVHFDVIVNNSTETFFFNGGANSLAPGQTAVWINGVEAIESYAFGRSGAATGEAIRSFDIRTFTNNPWAAEFDNIAISMIPEPSTYAFLFGLGILGAALIVRRRRS